MTPSSRAPLSHGPRVGPAGWSYADWRGRVYPPRPGPSFDALAWIARFFETVEVNASFYRIPSPRQAESWARRIEDRPSFRFCVKAPGLFTHGERRLDPADLAAFADFLAPLREAGRLGPVLIQFPWSFKEGPAARAHLHRLAEALPEGTLAVELRHDSWADADGRIRLDESRLLPVSVDQPPLSRCLPPVRQGTGDRAYLRLHGRNAGTWFDPAAGRDARYDYTYDLEELRPWTRSLRGASEAYVITNNHFQGQAVVNALQIRALLGQDVPAFPRWLEEEFPEIREALSAAGAPGARPVDEAGEENPTEPPDQGELF